MTDYIFAFNGRMLAMLGLVLLLLLALSFGLGVLYAEHRSPAGDGITPAVDHGRRLYAAHRHE